MADELRSHLRRLNRAAAEQLQQLDGTVHAVTDVTGYGLAGHGWEMAERGGVRVVLHGASLPAYAGAREVARRGVRTGGDARNRDYVRGAVVGSASDVDEALCYDPQTSGGLLAAVDPSAAAALEDIPDAWWRIGEVAAGEPAGVLF